MIRKFSIRQFVPFVLHQQGSTIWRFSASGEYGLLRLWKGDIMIQEIQTLSPKVNLTGSTQKLHARLCRLVGQAVADFSMIEEGDIVMVCLSGGKDSYGMLDVLLSMQSRSPVSYQLIAVNLDQKQPGFPEHILPDYLTKLGVPFHIEEQDTYSVVKEVIPEGKTTCSLCSRLRRGILYGVAEKLGATKIALGHHRDDLMETMVLNVLFNGTLKAMPPKLRSDDGEHIVIRPLAYVGEEELASYATLRDFPIIPCDLCGSQEKLKRKEVKALLKDWESRYPGSGDNVCISWIIMSPFHSRRSPYSPEAENLHIVLPCWCRTKGTNWRMENLRIIPKEPECS